MEEDIEFIKDKLVCEANYHNKDSCINCEYEGCQVKKFERIIKELKRLQKKTEH
ncbi:MAG: hypothetical protein RR585_10050 [Coprobacillus sp.]